MLPQEGYDAFYRALVQACRLKPVLELAPGLYATVRLQGKRRVYFINNPGSERADTTLKCALKDALTGKPLKARLVLAPFDVVVAVPVPSRKSEA